MREGGTAHRYTFGQYAAALEEIGEHRMTSDTRITITLSRNSVMLLLSLMIQKTTSLLIYKLIWGIKNG